MKTNKQNKQEKKNIGSPNIGSELQSRSEQSSGNSNSQTATAKAPVVSSPVVRSPSPRPYVNFEEREHNRHLPVDRVLAVLRRWMPHQYELAEVVGKWIWIAFPEQPVERVRADLSQLGFHWNNTRKCWQHPCGETLPRGQQEPREKYATYFPADQIAA
ncbi:MAG TPA: hypothetical protein VNZ64_02395 [Candidatus Acidoferrum sp.]|jgi:hypothetical protein|nr:hypothetical protein [Candidatus Acidoferrum sp.]